MLLPRPIHLHSNLLGTIRYFPSCVDVQSTLASTSDWRSL